MKTLILASFLAVSAPLMATETVGEKVKATAKEAVADAKKVAHRVEEAVCAKSDAKCLAEKAKNRVNEAATATSNAVEEVKDKAD